MYCWSSCCFISSRCASCRGDTHNDQNSKSKPNSETHSGAYVSQQFDELLVLLGHVQRVRQADPPVRGACVTHKLSREGTHGGQIKGRLPTCDRSRSGFGSRRMPHCAPQCKHTGMREPAKYGPSAGDQKSNPSKAWNRTGVRASDERHLGLNEVRSGLPAAHDPNVHQREHDGGSDLRLQPVVQLL